MRLVRLSRLVTEYPGSVGKHIARKGVVQCECGNASVLACAPSSTRSRTSRDEHMTRHPLMLFDG